MMDVVFVCGPPMEAHRIIKTEEEPPRWCYGERKRRSGKHILHGLDMDWVHANEAYGWAEPYWSYECDGCGEDRRWLG